MGRKWWSEGAIPSIPKKPVFLLLRGIVLLWCCSDKRSRSSILMLVVFRHPICSRVRELRVSLWERTGTAWLFTTKCEAWVRVMVLWRDVAKVNKSSKSDRYDRRWGVYESYSILRRMISRDPLKKSRNISRVDAVLRGIWVRLMGLMWIVVISLGRQFLCDEAEGSSAGADESCLQGLRILFV